MSILLTGGNGYIGRRVADALLARGHNVVCYNHRVVTASANERSVSVTGELRDIPRLLQVIRSHAVERIIHAAGQSHPAVSREAPWATIEANVLGSTCILEAARICGIPRVVLCSSECAYGDTPPGMVTESAALHPRTPYGASKAATEMLGAAYNDCFGMDTIALRISQVYGPGQVMPEPICDALRQMSRLKVYRAKGDRNQKMQLVHIADVTRAVVAACLVENHSLPVYNITGGVQKRFGELLDMICAIVPGAEYDVGTESRGGDDQGLFDLQAADRDLNYVPDMPLEQGLREYAEWLREHEV